VNVESTLGFLDQALDNIEAETGAVASTFGGEIGLKNLGKDLGWNSGASISHGDTQQWGRVSKVLNVQEPVFGAVSEGTKIQRVRQHTTLNIDRVRLRGALERIHRQVQEHLNEIGAVHADGNIDGQWLDIELMVLSTRMNASQVDEVREQLVHTDPGDLVGVTPEKAKIAAGDFNAVGYLSSDGLEPVLNELQILHFEASGVPNALVEELDKAGNDRERPIDIVDDAGVDFTPSMGHLLLDFLVLQLG
jgi:acetolactate synthase regulatory subunit